MLNRKALLGILLLLMLLLVSGCGKTKDVKIFSDNVVTADFENSTETEEANVDTEEINTETTEFDSEVTESADYEERNSEMKLYVNDTEIPVIWEDNFSVTELMEEVGQETQTYHGTYLRKVQDLPILGKTARLHITAHEYVCNNESCSKVTFVDDFSFKKRHTYGTIIVDQATHRPVAILDGRDGMTLKEWLKNNKHVKTVTRDRASAYSSAIQEILPDAMQIADRFHLHQNLLEAIKNTVNSVIPVDVRIPIDYGARESAAAAVEPCKKKMHCDVDKTLDYNEKSVQLYHAIHEYSEAGYSKRAISKMLHCSRNTVTKYLEGDYDSLCRKNFHSGMDQFYDCIIKELSSGVSRKDVFRNLLQKGYKGGQTAA